MPFGLRQKGVEKDFPRPRLVSVSGAETYGRTEAGLREELGALGWTAHSTKRCKSSVRI
jgi:hypothetical protein